ncbi:NADH-quinone oxidoreductase subunit J [Candidatus Hepatincolaceae symbiont of Richtersius coronifer]
MLDYLVFYMFSFFIIAGALGVILSKNPVYSVLLLIFIFFNSAAIFVLLKADFLAMMLVIVYVGAVAVLFLFIVMLLNVKLEEKKRYFNKYVIFGLVLVAILGIELYFFIKQGLVDFNPLLSNANSASTPDLGDIKNLGIYLFNDYYYVFIVSGLILTVSMIGAVILSIPDEAISSNFRQTAFQQNARTKKESVHLVDVEKEEGAK